MLSINEISPADNSGYVNQNKLIKQKRLPDQMICLADILLFNARYYLKRK